MFRAHVLIIRRSILHYTTSGIIATIGGRLVHEFCASIWLITEINKHNIVMRILNGQAPPRFIHYKYMVCVLAYGM